MRQIIAAERDQIRFGDVGMARLALDKGAGRLAPFRVRLGHHRGKEHGRMLVEGVLNLDR